MGAGQARGEGDDPAVGVLLTVAGWTGGGVVTGLLFQVARAPVNQGPFPTAHPLDAFLAVVAGSFLVGPLVAGALLWHWRQPRPVGTVVTLAGAAVVALVPFVFVVDQFLTHGLAVVGILLFVAGWGIVLPAGARAWVLASTSAALVRDFEEPGALGFAPRAGAADPWTAVPVGSAGAGLGAPPTAWPVAVGATAGVAGSPGGSLGWAVPAAPAATAAAAPVPGPPVDPSLPPIVLPPGIVQASDPRHGSFRVD